MSEGAYQTFAQYMDERWEQSEGHASKIIAAAEFCRRNDLPLGKSRPRRETHVRPLLSEFDNDEERVAAWMAVMDFVDGQKASGANQHFPNDGKKRKASTLLQ